jgi:cysteine desulfurase
VIYLDNAATTAPLPEVGQEVLRVMQEAYFNPSAAYGPAFDSEKRLSAARRQVAARMGAPADRVFFTSGGTESDNTALFGGAYLARARARRIVVSAGEHPAVLQAARRLGSLGWQVVELPLEADGTVSPAALERALEQETSLVSILHVNNETGAINDIAALVAVTRRRAPRALFHCDGVQALGKVPVDVKTLGVDSYAVSGHKIHGPRGVGALYLRERLDIVGLTGGGQESGVRSGTENLPAICGFALACERADPVAMAPIATLKERLWAGIQAACPGALRNGPAAGMGAPNILSVAFPGVRGEVLLHALEQEDILVGTGSACSARKQQVSHVLLAMGLPKARADGTLRLSLSRMTTAEQVDAAASRIAACANLLARYQRR